MDGKPVRGIIVRRGYHSNAIHVIRPYDDAGIASEGKQKVNGIKWRSAFPTRMTSVRCLSFQTEARRRSLKHLILAADSQLMLRSLLVPSFPRCASIIQTHQHCRHNSSSASSTDSSESEKINKQNKPRLRMIRAPAAERNKQPIQDVLMSLFPAHSRAHVLEIASGTGQHVIHFAQHFRNMTFTPTDFEPSSVETIRKNMSFTDASHIREPQVVDVSLPVQKWPASVTDRSYDLIICSNMIHISPWKCTEGLFAAADQLLSSDGRLVTYGPYAVSGILEPESNIQFDHYLKSQDPEWGVRDTDDISRVADKSNLQMVKMFPMPANNKILLFHRKTIN